MRRETAGDTESADGINGEPTIVRKHKIEILSNRDERY